MRAAVLVVLVVKLGCSAGQAAVPPVVDVPPESKAVSLLTDPRAPALEFEKGSYRLKASAEQALGEYAAKLARRDVKLMVILYESSGCPQELAQARLDAVGFFLNLRGISIARVEAYYAVPFEHRGACASGNDCADIFLVCESEANCPK